MSVVALGVILMGCGLDGRRATGAAPAAAEPAPLERCTSRAQKITIEVPVEGEKPAVTRDPATGLTNATPSTAASTRTTVVTCGLPPGENESPPSTFMHFGEAGIGGSGPHASEVDTVKQTLVAGVSERWGALSDERAEHTKQNPRAEIPSFAPPASEALGRKLGELTTGQLAHGVHLFGWKITSVTWEKVRIEGERASVNATFTISADTLVPPQGRRTEEIVEVTTAGLELNAAGQWKIVEYLFWPPEAGR